MRYSLLAFFSLITFMSQAQLGGQQVFQFLNMPPSARVGALGGRQIALWDRDVTLGWQNPAARKPQMDRHLSMSVFDYFDDVVFGHVDYAQTVDSLATFYGALHFLNYGEFEGADQYGNRTGNFTAGEYALAFGAGAEVGNNFSVGAHFKFIWAHYEQYNSAAIAMDYAVMYRSNNGLFNASAVLANVGFQIDPFVDGGRDPMPLNLQLGATYRFEHMPLRLGVVAHNLNSPDFTYENPNVDGQRDLATGELIVEEIPLSEKIARHFIVNAEILLSENFHLRVGYSHQRRKEMTISSSPGLVGFSFGGGIRIYRFLISYARVPYHLAANTNQLTIVTNLSDWYSKK